MQDYCVMKLYIENMIKINVLLYVSSSISPVINIREYHDNNNLVSSVICNCRYNFLES